MGREGDGEEDLHDERPERPEKPGEPEEITRRQASNEIEIEMEERIELFPTDNTFESTSNYGTNELSFIGFHASENDDVANLKIEFSCGFANIQLKSNIYTTLR